MSERGQQGVTFLSAGHRLTGSLFLSQEEGPRPTILLLYGVPGIEKNYDLAHNLRANGHNALIFNYRGCWGSQGEYRLETIPNDVLAAVAHLSSGSYPEVDSRKMAVIGHSLGGWAAILAAAADKRLAATAVYGTVADPAAIDWTLEEIAREFTPWLSGVSPAGFASQWAALGEELNPLHRVSRLAPRPFLILHAQHDEVVPVHQAEALSRQAEFPHSFETHPAADHSFTWHRTWLVNRLTEWVCELAWEGKEADERSSNR
jgi:dipeptidyl aminopeptidase/acylaminoacyl peptidase